jgi:hypothetical protein
LLRRAGIALMMVAASTSKSPLNVYQTTRRNNLQNSHIQHLHVTTFMSTINIYVQLSLYQTDALKDDDVV